MFGRRKEEAPSREVFERVETATNTARRENIALDESRDNAQRMGPLSGNFETIHGEYRDSNNKFIDAMQDRLAKMLEASRREATELNEEYAKLIEGAQDALDKLRKFEVDKLGMKQKEPVDL